MNRRHLFFLFIAAALASGCTQPALTEKFIDTVNSEAACESLSGKLTDLLAQTLIDNQDLPSLAEFEKSLVRLADKEDRRLALKTYQLLTVEMKEKLNLATRQELLGALVGLEIGDQTTPAKAELKSQMQDLLRQLKTSASLQNKSCAVSLPTPTPAAQSQTIPLMTQSEASSGALKVMATAYQSCEAIRKPAMDATSPSVEGISIVGTHPNGVGKKRVVSDITALKRSHYYIREGVENSSCFNVQKSPLIYDYGGKPYATTASNSPLSLFKDAGDGTTVLGIDCSGYVFSALAAAGLRVSSGKTLKASLVYGINAAMYMDPVNNGLTCLSAVSSTRDSALLDGDILASSGHVVMITDVGSDPFGLSAIQKISDCTSAQMNYQRFDFSVLQSSPYKGGIGIDRAKASDYLSESTSMRSALLEYAVAACKAKFGSTSTIKPASARLVRHKLSSDCRDTAVAIEGSSCVQSCL